MLFNMAAKQYRFLLLGLFYLIRSCLLYLECISRPFKFTSSKKTHFQIHKSNTRLFTNKMQLYMFCPCWQKNNIKRVASKCSRH
ncbi:hypothetical protein XELAEV_18041292mg [Xenopus laevis]|uniref:Uncharacterized protein n=1 Tax=Xenopus laevis TaxID=8355 RepID=A0A974C1W9_XENLA|nr:hypothetical protein XELAEV_18041292mg [Xenopus laevis]